VLEGVELTGVVLVGVVLEEDELADVVGVVI